MDIHLDSPSIPFAMHSLKIDAAPIMSYDSSIAQCADSDAQSCGCCQSIIDVIVECFNAVLIWLGLKEKTIDLLLKDESAFLKLLKPDENILKADPSFSKGERIFYMLCDKEGQTLDLPDGRKFLIDHGIVKHVLRKLKSQIEKGFEKWGLIKFNGMTLLYMARSEATVSLLENEAPHLSFQIEY